MADDAYFDSPDGRVRVPAALHDPVLATATAVDIRSPEEVVVLFVRETADVGGSDDVWGEVVANIFMPRENWERTVRGFVELLPPGR